MLKEVRQHLVQMLWNDYKQEFPFLVPLFQEQKPALDHFSIIDLPSYHSGMDYLSRIFSATGFIFRGADYIPQRQNDFLWMVEEDYYEKAPQQILPQAVLADFRLNELSKSTQKIIAKYTKHAHGFDFATFEYLGPKLRDGNKEAAQQMAKSIHDYLEHRQWPIPTVNDYLNVKEENELLAWALTFGRKVNHFGIALHALEQYENIEAFVEAAQKVKGITFNTEGGLIKGSAASGLMQCGTKGAELQLHLADGAVEINNSFMEFVWRFPQAAAEQAPSFWHEYFTGFIPTNANEVIKAIAGSNGTN
jgi:hypothetical protein